MSFTQEVTSPERYWPFHFYAGAGILVNSTLVETFTFAKKFRVADIRTHFSVAIVSAIDYMINVSSINGSAYNTKILSQAINGVQDIFLHYSSYLQLNSGDYLNFETSLISTANWFGIDVYGWAVVG